MADGSAQALLQDVFGFDDFRGMQAEIIDHVLEGQNILAVMPTGAGKSLCFQIPALLLPGLTVVVSPLISLMQNQVDALKILGVEAGSLNSTNSPEDNDEIWEKIHSGVLKLLYLSPERLMAGGMMDTLERLNVSCFAIDEAHCISQWGAAFRPEYEDLSRLHTRFPTVPIIALTATADQGTREQICEKIFSGDVNVYLAGFDRPNISLRIEIKNGWKQQLVRFLNGRQTADGSKENGIVYCLSRKKTEEATKLLQDKGYNALAYHAGMPGHVREENLNRFMAEDDLIMVATIAFGMGIDKPDIRFVFHTDLPSSPEAYYQEIGRAGRDGAPAVAHMLYGMDDIRMRRMFIDNENSGDQHKMRGHHRLNSLLSICEAPECRRFTLLHYFGDIMEAERCGNCDLCDNPRETIDATQLGQKMLSAIYRTGQSFGMGHIVDILVGKLTERVQMRGDDSLPTFGVGKDRTVSEWKSIARQLMARAFITADMEYGSLKITESGALLLKGQESFRYRPDVVLAKGTGGSGSRRKKAQNVLLDMSEETQVLYQSLKAFRKDIAVERGVPAYVIFSDKSLVDMATKMPATLDQFGDIYGVGAGKQKEFGSMFISFIQENG